MKKSEEVEREDTLKLIKDKSFVESIKPITIP